MDGPNVSAREKKKGTSRERSIWIIRRDGCFKSIMADSGIAEHV